MALVTALELADLAGCSSITVHAYRVRGLIQHTSVKHLKSGGRGVFLFDDSLAMRVKDLVNGGREKKTRGRQKGEAAAEGNWDKDICDHNCALCFAMRRESMTGMRSSWPTSSKDEYNVTGIPFNRRKDNPSEMAFMAKGGPK